MDRGKLDMDPFVEVMLAKIKYDISRRIDGVASTAATEARDINCPSLHALSCLALPFLPLAAAVT